MINKIEMFKALWNYIKKNPQSSSHSINVVKLKSDCSKCFSKEDHFLNKNNHPVVHFLRVWFVLPGFFKARQGFKCCQNFHGL